ncbi:MAG: CHASE domain-containing protein [Methylococcaceae bacterium]
MFKGRLFKKTGFAWAILCAGLLVTVFTSLQVKQNIEQAAVRQFAFSCDQVSFKIQERLGAYALILRGGGALFAASVSVERNEWQAYIEKLQAKQSVVGVQGIGFTQVITADQLADHIAKIRSEGFPDYTVKPPGERAVYTSIIYLEPFRDRNLRAFGYDMYTEPVRRSAMDQARDTGEAALSGKVELVQETGTDVQAGVLMYVPVYRNGTPVDTVEQRRSALVGWAYSPYRMNDLMTGILADWVNHEGKTIELVIYDGREATPASLLYDSQPAGTADVPSLFYQQRMIDFNGHQWLLALDHTVQLSAIDFAPAWAVLAGGLALSGLLFGLMRSVINTQDNADHIAEGLTTEIRQAQEKIHLLLNSTAEAIYGMDMNGDCTFCNSACLSLTGYQHPDDLLGKNMHWQIHGKYADGTHFPVEECRIFQGFHKGERMHVDDEVLWRSDGTCFPAEYWSYPQIQDGKVVGAVVTFLDISERWQAAAAIQVAREYAENIVETMREPLVVLDSDLKILTANHSFYDTFKVTPEKTIGNFIYDLGDRQWDIPKLRVLIEDILPNATVFNNYEVEHDFPGIGRKFILLNAREIVREGIGSHIILLVMEDITERKRADDKLRKLSVAVEQSPATIVMTDITGAIEYVNPMFCQVTGYTFTEALGQNPRILKSGELTSDSYQELWNTILSGEVWRGQFHNIKKSGEPFWEQTSISPIKDDLGVIIGFVAVKEDITDLKQYEKQIIESEQRLLDILKVSPIGICITVNQGRELVFYNPSYAKLINNPQVLDVNPQRYYADAEDYQAIVVELAQGNPVLNSQIEFRNPDDGSKFWALSSYMPMLYQGKDAVLGWFYDITERIEMERELDRQMEIQRQLDETLQIANAEERAIFDSATLGIALLKDRVIMRCNRKLEDILGYASGELDGMPIRLLYPDEAAYQTSVKAVASDKFRFEQQLVRKNGSLFWARLSGQALDSNDPEKGTVRLIDDMTLEHEATDALLKAKEMAEDTVRIKSEFLANMSHEIRTPMNGVLGMLDLLCETDMTPVQRDWLDTAYSSGETLLGIINDILDFSKLEAGKFEVEQIDFNLFDLVDDCCAELATQAHAKGLELNCIVPPTLSLCWRGDPLRIRQVLTNLTGNAVKFTARGEVSVSVTASAFADDQVGLRFEVQDTGIGISPAAQAQLFKPFSQADSSTSRSFGGTGLGLSISKKLVELMGGTIGVNSIPGAGSRFWFTLPLTPCKSVEPVTSSWHIFGKRVLIVDDNATSRYILSIYLNRWGMAVSEADNGSTALTHLQTSVQQGGGYDLILLDMQMPVMDGLTLAKTLAQTPALANLPIILLSSGDQLEQADYQGTGIVQHLMKPVRQLQLFEAMVNALQGGLAAIPKPERIAIQRPSYQGKKVLVVEDEKVNQKVIVAKLAKFDIVPDLAENGQLALDKLAHSSYDLILMDCQMPVLDGYAATAKLRLLEARLGSPRQPVIAITANVLDGEREKCLAAGMDDYLSKPVVTEQLTAMLASRLGNQPAEMTPPLSVAPAASASDQAIWDATAALDNLDGDSALLDEMIALFLIEGPKQLAELSRAQTEGDLPVLARAAHTIKGAVACFFAASAKDCASVLEQAARSGQSADYQAMTDALTNAVTDLINSLQLVKNSTNLG